MLLRVTSRPNDASPATASIKISGLIMNCEKLNFARSLNSNKVTMFLTGVQFKMLLKYNERNAKD